MKTLNTAYLNLSADETAAPACWYGLVSFTSASSSLSRLKPRYSIFNNKSTCANIYCGGCKGKCPSPPSNINCLSGYCVIPQNKNYIKHLFFIPLAPATTIRFSHVFGVYSEPIEIVWQYHLSISISSSNKR